MFKSQDFFFLKKEIGSVVEFYKLLEVSMLNLEINMTYFPSWTLGRSVDWYKLTNS